MQNLLFAFTSFLSCPVWEALIAYTIDLGSSLRQALFFCVGKDLCKVSGT